jgi:hypothetical protein
VLVTRLIGRLRSPAVPAWVTPVYGQSIDVAGWISVAETGTAHGSVPRRIT